MLAGKGFCVIGHTVSVSFYDTKKGDSVTLSPNNS